MTAPAPPAPPGPGLVISAPASGSGKTSVTLGIVRALTRRGLRVAPAKVGPDYIDPAFHTAAAGRACLNLDGWAMRPETLADLAAGLGRESDLVLCEGVMGLLDGALVPPGAPAGRTADIAAAAGWPVVLVIDGRGMIGSVAAILAGFAALAPAPGVVGVILNRVRSPRAARAMEAACRAACPGVALLGVVPPDDGLATPSRHLGLVQAGERDDLESFLDHAAQVMERHLDLDTLVGLARRSSLAGGPARPLSPLGQRIAVARDLAFAFAYPALLDGWRAAGAEIVPFSPLAGAGPDARADAVYLPGGYPELHAGALAQGGFLDGLRAAAGRGASVFGECGGYMVLGDALIDAAGTRHRMAGLLGLVSSFAAPRLHLGYRAVQARVASALGPAGSAFRGHEFHYARIESETGTPLFEAAGADGAPLGPLGLAAGRVAGSFVHLIDRG